MRAPFSGLLLPYSSRSAISPGISVSAIAISLRPQSARLMSATLKSAWQRDRLDGASFLAAFVGVLIFGLNTGLVIGLMVSFASLIWQSSKPHVAIVGQLGGTGHFRNINRHDVVTFDNLLLLRIDESLFFGNSDLLVSIHNNDVLTFL